MAQTAVGDLVVNLDVNSTKFSEQLNYVKKELKQTGSAANDEALRIQQSFSRQENAARKAGISVGQYNAAMRMLRPSLPMWPRSLRVGRTLADSASAGRSG